MRAPLDNFKYEPDGVTTMEDALCTFIKEAITFGRIKGGEKLPTIDGITKATGLTFHKARRVVERLVREGYVNSRPHVGTVVCSRGKNVLRGRVLVAFPDVDTCRYYPTQLFDTINRRLTAAGYAVSVSSFPFDEGGSLVQLKSELLRATDLVIAMRTTPRVQRCIAESGVRHIFAYGDKPKVDDGSPWMPFPANEEALVQFADHCKNADVKHVVQVCFEDDEMLDAAPALVAKGIDCSWLTISRKEVGGRGRFADIMHYAYEMFKAMPCKDIPELLLFWSAHLVQGALMAFLERGICIPEDVKIVSFSVSGFCPVYVKPVTRFVVDPIDDGEKISDFALAVLAKGRIPPPPGIAPQYIFGATFPF